MMELRYQREVIVVLAFSLMLQLFAVIMNDVYVFIFFNIVFPLSFIAAAMFKEGRLFP